MRYLFLLAFLFNGCGYEWHSFADRPTLFVPLIRQDDEGLLTAEIVRSIASSGLFDIRAHKGRYRLEVEIASEGVSTVGYRRDPQQIHNETKKNLVGCEGRKSMQLSFTLFEGEKKVLGPSTVSAFEDFDYVDGDSVNDLSFLDKGGVRETVLSFSLGQLEPNEAAEEASLRPLYQKLSHKLVDFLASHRPN